MDKYLIRKNYKLFDDFEKFSNTECIPSYEEYKGELYVTVDNDDPPMRERKPCCNNSYDYYDGLKTCLPENSFSEFVMRKEKILNESKTFTFNFNDNPIYMYGIYYYTDKTNPGLTFTLELTYEDNSEDTKVYDHTGTSKAKSKYFNFNNKFIKNVFITVKNESTVEIFPPTLVHFELSQS